MRLCLLLPEGFTWKPTSGGSWQRGTNSFLTRLFLNAGAVLSVCVCVWGGAVDEEWLRCIEGIIIFFNSLGNFQLPSKLV